MALNLLKMTDTTVTYLDNERMAGKQASSFNPIAYGKELFAYEPKVTL